MNKLLVIAGPTATGKTKLALSLGKVLGGEVISADSRQVYRELDIGTGKGRVMVWGYDLVGPREKYSVYQYCQYAIDKIGDIQKRGKLPILAGGTGLYIKAVVDGIGTIGIPQDDVLRKECWGKSAKTLYHILVSLDPDRAGAMNQSDRVNPRRLVRAIEVAKYTPKALVAKGYFGDMLFIGLTAPRQTLFAKITEHVEERVRDGIEEEIKKLIDNGVSWEDQSMQSLGYRQLRGYFEGRITWAEAVRKWTVEEQRYAKRQLAWFGRDRRIVWFDITDPKYTANVEKMAQKWYDMDDAKKD